VTKIRVWLASDFISHRAELVALIANCLALECVGESDTSGAAFARMAGLHPDVLVLDFGHSDRKKMAALKKLIDDNPTTKTIVLGLDDDRRWVIRLLRQGVQGYLSHRQAKTELVRAIETIAQGNVFLSPIASDALLGEYRKRIKRRKMMVSE
jgi:DNA-binding NarL/FixJ family response regulator